MTNMTPPPGTPQTNTKSQVATLITTIGMCLTFVVSYFPENDDLQLWGGLALGLLTIAATAYGVWRVPNQPLQ